MIYIIWLTLFALFIFSFLSNNKIPIWIPIICYIIVVFFRIREKNGNYKDWLEINKRDEESKLNEVANEMADRGLTYSSIRGGVERKVIENFKYERKKQKRRFENELIDSLFLK